MAVNPTWYDLLGVEPDASTEEIRAAWKAAIGDLDPTDRRFRSLSEAGAVLLDPQKRAAYDARIAAEEAEAPEDAEGTEDAAEGAGKADTDVEAAGPGGAEEDAEEDAGESDDDAPGTDEGDETAAATAPRAGRKRSRLRGLAARDVPLVPWWGIACLGIVTLALVVSAVVGLSHQGQRVITAANNNETQSTFEENYGETITSNHTTLIEEDSHAALEAAKEAVVPLLSYDYQDMAGSKQRARPYLTEEFAKGDYDPLFAVLEQNAPRTRTKVSTLRPIDAGVIRAGEDRVQVLVLFDQPTTNAASSQPIPYRNYAVLTMAKQDGRWLVDAVCTDPTKCSSSGDNTLAPSQAPSTGPSGGAPSGEPSEGAGGNPAPSGAASPEGADAS